MNRRETRPPWRRLLMTIATTAAVAATGLAVATPASAVEAPDNACPQLEIIGARGTGQPPGLGIILTPLARQITQQVPQTVRTIPLDYPATFNYASSVRQGVAEVRRVMTATAAQCADTRFILLGYSQGADVMGDALAGGAGWDGGSALPADLASRVSAVLLFGDPTFTAGEPFNVTDGRASGIFPRGTGQLSAFADRIQSYCNVNDRFCQRGTSLAAHLDYRAVLGQATQFAVERVAADLGG